MKTVLCSVLLLVALSNFTSGQLSPTNFNPNILVHSQGLPNEFLLFVPDTTTQILFNPARANDYSGSFVYSTYLANYTKTVSLPVYYTNYGRDYVVFPTSTMIGNNESIGSNYTMLNSPGYTESFASGKNPTIAVATLLNAFNSKWLLLVTNGIANSKGTSDYNSSSGSNNNNPLYSSSYNSTSDRDDKNNLTTFRLSNIFLSKMGKSSVGIFASVNSNITNTLETTKNSSYNTNVGTNQYYYLSSHITNQNQKKEQDNSQYVLGFEYTLAKDNWDYISRFSYQKSSFLEKRNTFSSNQQNDSTYWGSSTPPSSSSYKSNSTTINTSSSQNKPFLLSFENYYQQKTTFLSLDGNLFFSANIYYSEGAGKTDRTYFYGYAAYNNATLTSKDTISGSSDGKFDTDNWGFSFTPGYLFKKNFSDLFLLTGLKLGTGYLKYNNTQTELFSNSSSSYPIFVTSTIKTTFVSLTLPLYVNYSPAEWISIWGGMTYTYGYNKSVKESSGNTIYDLTNHTAEYYSVNSNYNNSSFQSTKSTFFGLELKHSSGLRVQISFDEDVASFRDWNMSVGYHF